MTNKPGGGGRQNTKSGGCSQEQNTCLTCRPSIQSLALEKQNCKITKLSCLLGLLNLDFNNSILPSHTQVQSDVPAQHAVGSC